MQRFGDGLMTLHDELAEIKAENIKRTKPTKEHLGLMVTRHCCCRLSL